MKAFRDKVAIVTGGASGIGEALCKRLVTVGAQVVIADVNSEKAGKVAAGLKGAHTAVSCGIDVREAQAVQDLVARVVREKGRLDYMFNNAGVGTVGLAKDMALADWKRVIDINLNGVINGVLAAYPVMVRQGFGHIVNTGSIMGLTPAPLSVAYAASKYAVVGLSASLRAEAASVGVKVSVVCPGFIDTPMQHSNQYINMDKDAALRSNPFKMHSPEAAAREILDDVARNKATIVLTPQAKLMWFLYRVSPDLYQFASSLAIRANAAGLAK